VSDRQERVLEPEPLRARGLVLAEPVFVRQRSWPLPWPLRPSIAVCDSGSNTSALFLPDKDGGCMKRFQPKKWMQTEAPYPVQTHDQPRLQNDLA
jgi:hypothetical protein